jgi:hypothetical protein
MLFGFILVRVLLSVVKGLGRLPQINVSRALAAILNAVTCPFQLVNYPSALPGGTVLSRRALGQVMDTTIEGLRVALLILGVPKITMNRPDVLLKY